MQDRSLHLQISLNEDRDIIPKQTYRRDTYYELRTVSLKSLRYSLLRQGLSVAFVGIHKIASLKLNWSIKMISTIVDQRQKIRILPKVVIIVIVYRFIIDIMIFAIFLHIEVTL